MIEINEIDQFEKLKSLIPQIQGIFDRYSYAIKDKKGSFNILSCLTKHHREELHTKVIRYLLNPKENHGCGSIFLRKFIKVLREDNQLARLRLLPKIESREFEDAQVELKDKYSEDYGRMDIFIETRNAIIVIENKVRAGEQEDQILRYVTYCEQRRKNFIVLYLTLDGTDSKQAGDKKYYSISYYTHIRKWIRECLRSLDGFEMVVVGLKYYLNMLEKSILNLSTSSVTMELKELLLQDENKNIIKFLPELCNVLVPLRNHLRSTFFIQVHENLVRDGYELKPTSHFSDTIDLNLIWEEMYRGFKLTNKEFEFTSTKGRTLHFSIEHDWHNLYFGLIVAEKSPINVDFDTDAELKRLYTKLNDSLDLSLAPNENCWMAFRHSSIYERDKFGDDSLNYLFATEMPRLVGDFVNEVKVYLEAFKNIINSPI